MARNCKPNISNLGEEGTWIIHDSLGSFALPTTNINCLFDSIIGNYRWDSPSSYFYFYPCNTGHDKDYLEITFNQYTHIWSHPTTTYLYGYMNPLRIYKYDDGNWIFIDYTKIDDDSGDWRCITKEPLKPGRYSIEMHNGDSPCYSLHSEWYIETIQPPLSIASINYNIISN